MIKVDKSHPGGILLTSSLQKGVWVEFLARETVTDFILRILSLQKETMEREVQTLILNNGCVDSPDTHLLQAGDVLVCSGAMPGLVGAMLRSNSPIKAMRQGVSSLPPQDAPRPNWVKVKLFNSVLVDHKDDLLATGFYLEDE